MMVGSNNAIRKVHQANIGRHRRLLQTYLTDHERQFIERRLAEEEEALREVTNQRPSLLIVPRDERREA